ncbi:hypothetical protein ES703_14962 [subsurface metagenome]
MTLDTDTTVKGIEQGMERGLYYEAFGRTDQDFYNMLYNMLLRYAKAQVEDSITDIEGSTSHERLEQTENSTTQLERPEGIEQQIDTLFEEAVDQDFEDGMESRFSRELLSLVRKYGDFAVNEINYLINHKGVNSEVAAEALLWLGDMDHPATYDYRLWLLERSLGSSSSRVRDRAALGLASMAHPHAIPYIKEAIDQETCTELREDIAQVLAELEANYHASHTKDNKQK